MPETLLVKLGGSVITDKGRTDFNVQTDIVKSCMTALKVFLTERPGSRLVLIHGAGGHIHHLAKTYGLTTSSAGLPEKINHAQRVQVTTRRLSDAILSLANELSLPIVQIPTCEVVRNHDSNFEDITMGRIESALSAGSIPLLYGDMVPDATWEYSICSGDTLIAEIASRIAATRIIYVSDINGIYTSDPHTDQTAKLIESININELNNDNVTITGSHNVDVTGGLAGKLAPLSKLFKEIPSLTYVEVCNGLENGVLQAVLKGESSSHTTITK